MSFNIQHDRHWDERSGQVLAILQDERPDIVGLQEALVWQLETLSVALPGYDWFGAGRDDGVRAGESTGVLYDADRFERTDAGHFWLSDRPALAGSVPGDDWGNPTLPRMVTWLRLVDKATGNGLYFYNLHLQHDAGSDPRLNRIRSVELLLDRIARRERAEPVVVVGDFNAVATEAAIRRMTDGAMTSDCPASAASDCRATTSPVFFADAFDSARPRPATTGTRCFDGADTGRRIDYVFVSSGIETLSYRVGQKQGDRCASDHRFVLARLLLR